MALNFSSLMAAAIENRSSAINDVLSKSNCLLHTLRKHGGVKPFDGGTSITENIMYSAPGANAQAYSGNDTLNTNVGEHLTMAQWGISQYATAVSISGLEIAQNSGKSRMLDLLETRITAAEADLSNLLCTHLYGDGSVANSIVGIGAMVPVANTAGTYGGIDRVANTWWRNKSSSGTVLTAANIQQKYRQLFLQIGRNDSERPNIIIASAAHFDLLSESMVALQRFEPVSGKETVSAGFVSLQFMGCPVFLENNAFGSTGMATDVSYFINSNVVKLRPFKSDGIKTFDGTPTDKDATVQRMKWYGQLTCNNQQLTGTLKG